MAEKVAPNFRPGFSMRAAGSLIKQNNGMEHPKQSAITHADGTRPSRFFHLDSIQIGVAYSLTYDPSSVGVGVIPCQRFCPRWLNIEPQRVNFGPFHVACVVGLIGFHERCLCLFIRLPTRTFCILQLSSALLDSFSLMSLLAHVHPPVLLHRVSFESYLYPLQRSPDSLLLSSSLSSLPLT